MNIILFVIYTIILGALGSLLAAYLWERFGKPTKNEAFLKKRQQERYSSATRVSEKTESSKLPGSVQDLPPHFLPRPEDVKAVKEKLWTGKTVGITTAIYGMGGIGKSVLAAAVARDEEVEKAFAEGVIWLTIGQEPNLLENIKIMGAVFKDDPGNYVELKGALISLERLLKNRKCLIILDDIWNLGDVEPFRNALGDDCRMLITTRDASIVTSLGAQEYKLEILTESASLNLLSDWCGQEVKSLPSRAKEVAKECGYLPLALAMCGAMVRDGTSWGDLLDALRTADLTFIQHRLPDCPYTDILKSLKVSVDMLEKNDPEAFGRYHELAAFPADELVPEAAVTTLWTYAGKVNERRARQLLTTLERKALLRLQGVEPKRMVSLHDLQYDYLRYCLMKDHPHPNLPPSLKDDDLAAVHGKILAAYEMKCMGEQPPLSPFIKGFQG